MNENQKKQFGRECGIRSNGMLFKLRGMVPYDSFPADLMHLFFLNFAEMSYKLMSGVVDDNDNLELWSLSHSRWKSIGKDLQNSRRYIPSSWGRPPSDIYTYSSGN
jgi:hypothetical protein